MNVISKLVDKKIKALNLLAEITIKEYLELTKVILNKNPYQRRRVSAASVKTVYGLLREDLKEGCAIPAMVLATLNSSYNVEQIQDKDYKELEGLIDNKDLIILDGLQRTYTLLDSEEDLIQSNDPIKLAEFYDRIVRVEIYIAIKRIGILYRMLTLNTGQTPMSIRHQIEILYSDFYKNNSTGIILYRESDGTGEIKLHHYKFSDVIDGFLSFLIGDELSFDKEDLLQDIKGLESLSEGQNLDIFVEFLKVYDAFVAKMILLTQGWNLKDVLSDTDIKNKYNNQPFGRTGESIFVKPQLVTGFGAAVYRLIELGSIKDLADLSNKIERINLGASVEEVLLKLLENLEKIRKTAPKIGNYQRIYFYQFFRILFDNEKDTSYLNVFNSIVNSFNRYNRDI